MNHLTLSFILVSILFSCVAQILLKHGMSNQLVLDSLQKDAFTAFKTVATNFFVISGLSFYVLGAVVWLLVLSKTEVSKAYPFVGLGFIGTMLFAYWFLNEPITSSKLAGTVLVILGVFLISK